MRRPVPPTAALAAALLLTGCATNALRAQAATDVAARGREALTATAAYLDSVEQRRREAAAALVASDPSCLPATPLRLQVPTGAGASPAPLCPEGDTPAPGYAALSIDVGTSPRALLEPRVALLAAVGDYVEALATVVAAPTTDVSAELTAFAERVGRVAAAAGVADADPAAPRGQGLVALAAFAAELAREARTAGKVRALVEERGDAVDRALAELRGEVEGWGRTAARSADDLYGNALFRTYLRHRADLTAEQREQLAARVFAAREAARTGPARAAAVADALALASTAQADLRAALSGRLTPAQRSAAAKLNLDRIARALALVATVARPL
ncbi:hypothetical protein [Sphingomonas sp. BK580]|uniref:hypothetical protein n=1 Tax=Sphingomonas sp. BK580 TaxID=2586972 RepID=UPI00161BFDE0|nr:hypothetical protein [Sphingomonas sp. BK580]MBB3693245.1 cell wall-associated NlpC family hydrolase [Sphingomonas sp. BK580]